MKEAFELIKERLEEKKDNLAHNSELYREHGNERQVLICESETEAYTDALSIVSEVEAEYEQQDHTDYANIELYAFWKEHQWILCSERLPEESGEYLTYVEYDGDKFIAIDECFCGGILKEWNCTPNYRVIAWMPLPEPYKPEKGV